MKIKFKEYKKDGLLGFLSIQLEGVWVSGFTVREGRDGNPWIAPPTKKNGKGEYEKLVFLTKEKAQEALSMIEETGGENKQEYRTEPLENEDEFPF